MERDFRTLRLLGLLFAIDLAVVILFGLHLVLDRFYLFNLDAEPSVGAWWGGTKLVMAGSALAGVPLLLGGKAPAGAIVYLVMGAGFFYLSADEMLEIHEKMSKFNIEWGLGIPMFQGSRGAWISVYAGLGIVLMIAFFRPLWRLASSDRTSASLVAFGMATVVLGAVVFEIMGFYDIGPMGIDWVQVGLEESLELFGVSMVVTGCARHLATMLHHAGARRRVPSATMVPALS